MPHLGQADLYDLFEHLPNTGDLADFDATVKALNRHFDPQLNPGYERFKLRQAHQTDDESINTFYACLRR